MGSREVEHRALEDDVFLFKRIDVGASSHEFLVAYSKIPGQKKVGLAKDFVQIPFVGYVN